MICFGMAGREITPVNGTLDIFIWVVLVAVQSVRIFTEIRQALVDRTGIHPDGVSDILDRVLAVVTPKVGRDTRNGILADVEVVFIVFNNFTPIYERATGDVNSPVERCFGLVLLV